LIGHARAFLHSGAPYLVASLCPLNADALAHPRPHELKHMVKAQVVLDWAPGRLTKHQYQARQTAATEQALHDLHSEPALNAWVAQNRRRCSRLSSLLTATLCLLTVTTFGWAVTAARLAAIPDCSTGRYKSGGPTGYDRINASRTHAGVDSVAWGSSRSGSALTFGSDNQKASSAGNGSSSGSGSDTAAAGGSWPAWALRQAQHAAGLRSVSSASESAAGAEGDAGGEAHGKPVGSQRSGGVGKALGALQLVNCSAGCAVALQHQAQHAEQTVAAEVMAAMEAKAELEQARGREVEGELERQHMAVLWGEEREASERLQQTLEMRLAAVAKQNKQLQKQMRGVTLPSRPVAGRWWSLLWTLLTATALLSGAITIASSVRNHRQLLRAAEVDTALRVARAASTPNGASSDSYSLDGANRCNPITAVEQSGRACGTTASVATAGNLAPWPIAPSQRPQLRLVSGASGRRPNQRTDGADGPRESAPAVSITDALARVAGLRGALREAQARMVRPRPAPSVDTHDSTPAGSPVKGGLRCAIKGGLVDGDVPLGSPPPSAAGGGQPPLPVSLSRHGGGPEVRDLADRGGTGGVKRGRGGYDSGTPAKSRRPSNHFLAASPGVARRLADRLEALHVMHASPLSDARESLAGPLAPTGGGGDSAAPPAVGVPAAAATATPATTDTDIVAAAVGGVPARNSALAAAIADLEVTSLLPVASATEPFGTSAVGHVRQPDGSPSAKSEERAGASPAVGNAAASGRAGHEEHPRLAEKTSATATDDPSGTAFAAADQTGRARSCVSDDGIAAEGCLAMTASEDTEAHQAGHASSRVLATAAESGPATVAAAECTEADQAGSLLRRRAAGAAELASVLQSADDVAPQLATCPIVLPDGELALREDLEADLAAELGALVALAGRVAAICISSSEVSPSRISTPAAGPHTPWTGLPGGPPRTPWTGASSVPALTPPQQARQRLRFGGGEGVTPQRGATAPRGLVAASPGLASLLTPGEAARLQGFIDGAEVCYLLWRNASSASTFSDVNEIWSGCRREEDQVGVNCRR